LKEFGFTVDVIHRRDEALEVILDNRFDAIFLDIMLPGRDGLSVLRTLRDRSNAVPVLILTARGEVCEKVEGLGLGADDYLAKLASIEEVAARLRALIQTGETLVRYRIAGPYPCRCDENSLQRQSAHQSHREKLFFVGVYYAITRSGVHENATLPTRMGIPVQCRD
jgi:DNA-binding response OmpR family regulator